MTTRALITVVGSILLVLAGALLGLSGGGDAGNDTAIEAGADVDGGEAGTQAESTTTSDGAEQPAADDSGTAEIDTTTTPPAEGGEATPVVDPECEIRDQEPIEPTAGREGGVVYRSPSPSGADPIVVVLHRGGSSVTEVRNASGWCSQSTPLVLVVPEGLARSGSDQLWWQADGGELSPQAPGQTDYVAAAVAQGAAAGGDANSVVLVGVDNGAAMAMQVACALSGQGQPVVLGLVDPVIHESALPGGASAVCAPLPATNVVIVSTEGGSGGPAADVSGYQVGSAAVSTILTRTLGCDEVRADPVLGMGCDVAVAVHAVADVGDPWHADTVPDLLLSVADGSAATDFPKVAAGLESSAGLRP